MITGLRFNDRKKTSSARWKVLYFPSLYKGTWKVITSHSRAICSSEQKFVFPSFSSLGRSFSNTRIPCFWATSMILPPTFPTPTMPIHILWSSFPFTSLRRASTDSIYCATEAELHPGALAHVMPAFRQYSVSMWSKPMVAVAINFTWLPSNNSRLQCVRVRIINASASRTSSGVKSFPGIYTTSSAILSMAFCM